MLNNGNISKSAKTKISLSENKSRPSFKTMAEKFHQNIQENEVAYRHLGKLGIKDGSIEQFKIGIGKFTEQYKFTIPVLNKDGQIAYFKLLRTQDDDSIEAFSEAMGVTTPIPKWSTYPSDIEPILIGEDQLIKSNSSDVMICNNEIDRIIAIQEGVKMPVVTGGGGVQTFKDKWADQLKNIRNIYICVNKEGVGKSGAKKIAKQLADSIPSASIYLITLPFDDKLCTDLADYFAEKHGTAEELFSKYACFYCGAKPIDVSQFEEMNIDDLAGILSSTIKHDFESKIITFLAMLLAYTEDDQLNIMFNAGSSTGKSYICHEVSKYFPEQDVNIYGKTTPTAFYHTKKLRKIDPETGEPFIDLARRIMVFVEQPDPKLQVNLRALLSHEKKRVPFAITNKEKGGRNSADEGYLLGYPSTFFCSANMSLDEQEQTRGIVLSPENSREKVMAGINTYIEKSCHRDDFDERINNNKLRKSLIERILYIKSLNVKSINVGDSDYLEKRFIDMLNGNIPTGSMRKIAQFTSLAKSIALLNAPFRTSSTGEITVFNKDIDEAARLWIPISLSATYSLSPQLFNFYKDIILCAWNNKKKELGGKHPKGITLAELRKTYFEQLGGFPSMENMRKQWIPMLEIAQFVNCVFAANIDTGADDNDGARLDGRCKLVIPLVFFDDMEK